MNILLSVPYYSQRENKYVWTHDNWLSRPSVLGR